jgi:SAM-dependent methyltransferase
LRAKENADLAAADARIGQSVRAYAKAHRHYDRRHGEIFNAVEQERLRLSLRAVVDTIQTDGSAPKRALDFGCGTGNLTRHFLELGLDVVAADVSPQFLATIDQRFGGSGRVETLQLNGVDLHNVPSEGLDMVAAYSVLHHIPDYLGAIGEMCRVVRPGGVVYLDHEVSEAFWESDGCVAAFRRELDEAAQNGGWWNPRSKRWQRFLIPEKYLWGLRRLRNPRFQLEGDIHVWEDDHIEWSRVEERLASNGCDVLQREDYLLYREGYPQEVYDRYRSRCGDMTVVVARKHR